MTLLLGPWREPEILKQLEQRNPLLPKHFLNFDITKGDANSLKILDDVHVVPAVENASLEEELVAAQQMEAMENEAALEEELNELEKAGVSIL